MTVLKCLTGYTELPSYFRICVVNECYLV